MKSKLKWSPQEKNLLKELGNSQNKRKWVEIAKQINTLCPEKQRTSKQCRQKYINHVQYEQGQNSQSWTREEEHFLFQQYQMRGSKWKIISSLLQNKSENAVKNKFYGKIRKLVRRLNNICRQRINKSNKPLRDESIMRIIDIQQGFENLPQHLIEESLELKKELLGLAQNDIVDYENWSLVEQNNVVSLIKKIHKFNMNSRYFCSKKRKNLNRRKQNPHLLENSQKTNVNLPIGQNSSQAKKLECQKYKIIPIIHIPTPKLKQPPQKIQPLNYRN